MTGLTRALQLHRSGRYRPRWEVGSLTVGTTPPDVKRARSATFYTVRATIDQSERRRPNATYFGKLPQK